MKPLIVGLLSLTLFTVGCSNECQKLVDYSCEKIGATSMQCRSARALAKAADSSDQNRCKTALKVLKFANWLK